MPRTNAVALILVAACGTEDPIETVVVAPVLAPCVGANPQLCMLITPEDKPQHLSYDGIEGFDHRWGVESEVTLRREEVEDPPADASSVRLILVDTVVENDIALGSFDLDFPRGPWFSGTGTELQMSGTTIQCEQVICDQLLAADASDTGFSATFELVDGDTLRATAVTP